MFHVQRFYGSISGVSTLALDLYNDRTLSSLWCLEACACQKGRNMLALIYAYTYYIAASFIFSYEYKLAKWIGVHMQLLGWIQSASCWFWSCWDKFKIWTNHNNFFDWTVCHSFITGFYFQWLNNTFSFIPCQNFIALSNQKQAIAKLSVQTKGAFIMCFQFFKSSKLFVSYV